MGCGGTGISKDTKHHVGNIGLMMVLLVLLCAPFLGIGLMKIEDSNEVLSEADVRQNVPVVKVMDANAIVEDVNETTSSEDIENQ